MTEEYRSDRLKESNIIQRQDDSSTFSSLSMTKGGWGHKISLNPPFFMEISVPSQYSEQSCVLGVFILLLFQ